MSIGRLINGKTSLSTLRFAPSIRSMKMSTKSTTERVPLILTPKEVQSLIIKNSSPIRILDSTWFMPNVKRNAKEEFEKGPRIKNSLFWDVDEIATLKGEKDEQGNDLNPLNLVHMMPSPKTFAIAAGQHGITPNTHVIVYDTHGVFTSPRIAFTFHAFGHPAISILNGGLPAWIAEGYPTEEGESNEIPQKSDYPIPSLQSTLIRSYDEMVGNARMGARGQTVLDARPFGRFEGSSPEPRPGLSSGHIPNSLSLPATDLLETKTVGDKSFTILKQQTDLWRTISDSVGGMENLDKLRQASSAGESAVTNTCGSGMTAAILWLGLYQLGIQSSIYDESWTGYASRKESVIEKE